MQKGLLIIALATLLVLPMTALAGMWSVTEDEMENVTGQTGISIDLSFRVTSGYLAYGDSDGGTGYTSPGFFTLSGMRIENTAGTGNMSLTGLTIDVGSSGATGAIVIGLPALSGRVYFSDLKLGSAADAGNSLGSLTLGNVGTTASSITIRPK